jgi:leader peptidase (prepilin peptidase)/N-methyltransferase
MAISFFLYYFYIFFLGACIGSFINVVALRIPQKTGFVNERSLCPNCGKTLRYIDLIPVFSYIILKGRCHNCKSHISLRYPFVEIISGALYVLCFWWYGFSFFAVNSCILVSLLLCVFLIDMDTMTIPNGLILCFLIPCAIDLWLTGFDGMATRMIGFFIISVPMYLLTLLIPDSFGGGDIKLMAVCGFLLGYKAGLLAAFIAIIIAGIFATFLLIRKKVKKGQHIAFGPFLTIGIFVSKLFYYPIFGFYLKLLGY